MVATGVVRGYAWVVAGALACEVGMKRKRMSSEREEKKCRQASEPAQTVQVKPSGLDRQHTFAPNCAN